jgi:hypothetical protein
MRSSSRPRLTQAHISTVLYVYGRLQVAAQFDWMDADVSLHAWDGDITRLKSYLHAITIFL